MFFFVLFCFVLCMELAIIFVHPDPYTEELGSCSLLRCQRGLVRSTTFRAILKPGIRTPEFRNVLSILSRRPSSNYCKSSRILVDQRIKIVYRNVSLCYKLTSVSSSLVLADDMFKDSSYAIKTML